MSENVIETSQARRPFDLAKIGYVFFSFVVLYWLIWLVCVMLNPTPSERLFMFYSVLPKTIFSISIDTIIVLFSVVSLFLGIVEKISRSKKWYKTEGYIRILIILSSLLLFMNIFQLIF